MRGIVRQAMPTEAGIPGFSHGPGRCLPPMTSRPAAKPREPRPSPRHKAFEERSAIEAALDRVTPPALCNQARKQAWTAAEAASKAEADAEATPLADTCELQLRVLRRDQVEPIEIVVASVSTVDDLKNILVPLVAIPAEDQRLYWRFCRLPEEQTLASCGLTSGRHDIHLIPELTFRATGVSPIRARRGLMVPVGQATPWKPNYQKITLEDCHSFFGTVEDTVQKASPKKLALQT
eukprot:TRINITY_DN23541_c0_g1_i1.p1 TRINITY_DN23541_c0_g1~~TRINITY_DN23541_c0_g1_i1.p1  ORF type:complete len:236 (-),score=50.93 TRINITY_DN23541_c0_g1_i1:92-799(-)